ncbi:hypothetical protein OOZ63_02280 [Paucibacter sp. PLA-PC-4]|uniref:hypothetical protein n=1 Tax=Paucibacter sp. PLA-PC-4 TaxID=2993655 RepID=UPI0022496DF0|nr:hypothetical protein [Paucibacter sp. PLA-PC-4]MCX2860659.1 hypothetical protein [Paucibacter sp. PLA-PC-4]
MNRPGVRQHARQQSLPADLRSIGAVACALLLLAGAALPGWRWLQGLTPTPWQLAICALPPTLGLAAMAAATPPRQTLVHLFACLLMLPLLLLMWGSSLPGVVAEAPSPGHRLAETRLFDGAQTEQEIATGGPNPVGLTRMRGAHFADGSELRLLRFETAEAAERYLDFIAAALQGRRGLLGERPVLRLHQQLWVERHGADLLELRAASAEQALARLHAQGLPAPSASEAATTRERSYWPFALVYTGAQLLSLLVFVRWVGRRP